jgi:hypothetical protein
MMVTVSQIPCLLIVYAPSLADVPKASVVNLTKLCPSSHQQLSHTFLHPILVVPPSVSMTLAQIPDQCQNCCNEDNCDAGRYGR